MPQIALITGSSSGLAVAFARRLAALQYTLVLNYRDSKARCESLAKQLTETHGIEAIAIQADMRSADQIKQMMDAVQIRYGRLDVLIHSAGPFIFRRKRMTDYEDYEWLNMIDGNLTSAFHLFKRAIPMMRPQGFGRIVTVGFSHVEDVPGWVYRSAYAAAKTGLASLTRSVALEERENGITANMICPGDIRGSLKEASWDEDEEFSPLRTPIGEDLAHMIEVVVSRQAQYLTGNILSITGDVDVIGHFDTGKEEVFDAKTLAVGTPVWVIPWQAKATVMNRQDRANRRSIYTVEKHDKAAQFTIDQLIEVSPNGF